MENGGSGGIPQPPRICDDRAKRDDFRWGASFLCLLGKIRFLVLWRLVGPGVGL
jgi:hypothetical protein